MRSLRHCLTAAALGLALLSPAARAASPSPLARALADPARSAQRGTDVRRHPGELVAHADAGYESAIECARQIELPGVPLGSFPGSSYDEVSFDLIPGDGYWTRIFSKMVGPKGRVYAVWPQAYASHATGNVSQLQQIAKQYGNVTVQVQPGTTLTAPEPLDVVWTSDNYHDYNDKFMGKPGSLAFARSAFRILKPGGLFIVIDHSAAVGHGLRDTETMHRIERAQR